MAVVLMQMLLLQQIADRGVRMVAAVASWGFSLGSESSHLSGSGRISANVKDDDIKDGTSLHPQPCDRRERCCTVSLSGINCFNHRYITTTMF